MAFTGDYDSETIPTTTNHSNPPRNALSEAWQYDEQLPSDPDNCSQIISVLLDQLESFQWNNRDTFGIHMAMEEAVLNAIRHGNQCDPEKLVRVEMEISHERFYSRITDQGDGFDPAAIPDPTLEENLEKTSGRGVMLMNSFVDKVVYNDVGNSVELKKTRTSD